MLSVDTDPLDPQRSLLGSLSYFQLMIIPATAMEIIAKSFFGIQPMAPSTVSLFLYVNLLKTSFLVSLEQVFLTYWSKTPVSSTCHIQHADNDRKPQKTSLVLAAPPIELTLVRIRPPAARTHGFYVFLQFLRRCQVVLLFWHSFFLQQRATALLSGDW